MEKNISKIAKYSDDDIRLYFKMEKLSLLHKMKIYADDIYYNTGKSSGLNDWQYDMLKDVLQKRDPNYIVPIGAKIRENENRAELPFWLGSMDRFNPENTREISQWLINNNVDQYIIEDKLDGVSCLALFKGGKIKLYTKGDGSVGADISYLAQYLSTIPKKLSKDIIVRGELIIKDDTFKKKYIKEYANPRNMVSGLIGAKTMRKGLVDVDFIAYEIVEKNTRKPSEQLEYLDKLGFTTVRREIKKNFDILSLMEILTRFKRSSPYTIDGIIVHVNTKYIRNESGNPKYAFAFKMRMDENLIKTQVVGVDWNISKWGRLKPRIEIKPVYLGSVTITWVTGFNAKFIVNESIGDGAVVEITRSGDVIPYIVRVVKKAKTPDMPEIPYKWNDTGVDIFTEEYGSEMCIKLISNFFSKLGIKFLGEENVRKIHSVGYDTILKILSLSQKDFMKVPNFGLKMSERIYKNIHDNLKNLSISLVLGASGVFGFGIGIKKVTLLFDDFPDILEKYKTMTNDELFNHVLHVKGYSNKTAEKIVKNIEWADMFINEMKRFATFKEEKVVLGSTIHGMKVVFSGFRDSKLEEYIESMGGKVTTSVSSKTTVVIVFDVNSTDGKPQKARELGIPVITTKDFMRKYN
jgi:DNA ligase (NAD+)